MLASLASQELDSLLQLCYSRIFTVFFSLHHGAITLIELLKIFPLRVAGEGLVRFAVLATFHNDDLIAVGCLLIRRHALVIAVIYAR